MAKRFIVSIKAQDAKLYELIHEGLGSFRAGKDARASARGALGALEGVGVPKMVQGRDPKTGRPTGELVQAALGDGDFPLLTIDRDVYIGLQVGEREVIRAMTDGIDWPTYALKLLDRVVSLLDNAEPAAEASR